MKSALVGYTSDELGPTQYAIYKFENTANFSPK